MSADKTVSMVSLNDIVGLLRQFSRENLGTLTDPGRLADCDGRCGCVGGNCECRGGVFSASRLDLISYPELQALRQARVADLKEQLEALEGK